MGTQITIDNLVKVFGSGKSAATACDHLSLTIEPGELFFLLGPSGCGKTTLLRMIAGFIDPTGGTIAFDGKDVTHEAPNKRNTGMVFQSYALWPHMTVAQNVAFGLNVRKVANPEKDQRVIDALAAVQMEEYAARKPNQLSGGQQQRVALARALVIKPDVLLLDEPLSNLDAKLRNDLRLQIRKICKDSGITTVYVTHDQKEALMLADRLVVMKEGRIMQIGRGVDIYNRPNSRFVANFLGKSNFFDGLHRTPDSFGTQSGLKISCMNSDAVIDEQTTLSVRPESIKLGPKASKLANSFVGKVERITYLGSLTEIELRLTETDVITVQSQNQPGGIFSSEIGASVAVGWAAESAHLINEHASV